VDPERLATAVAVNGTSLVPLTQGLLPVLRPGSSVIYVSSQGARKFVPSYVALGPSKALGEALIRYLAVELAPPARAWSGPRPPIRAGAACP
jgi:enoyl-[acyl-carrier-protein] reductase (NADH)